MTKSNFRALLCGAALALALIVPAGAAASWNLYYGADLAPSTNAQTSSHQQRYTKLLGWVNGANCAKTWYRNNGSIVDYYVVEECDGTLQDNRNSTATAWTYCRNTSGSTINIDCYTCINDSIACP